MGAMLRTLGGHLAALHRHATLARGLASAPARLDAAALNEEQDCITLSGMRFYAYHGVLPEVLHPHMHTRSLRSALHALYSLSTAIYRRLEHRLPLWRPFTVLLSAPECYAHVGTAPGAAIPRGRSATLRGCGAA